MRRTKWFATFMAAAGLLTACPAEKVSAVPAGHAEAKYAEPQRAEPQRAEAPPVQTLNDFSEAIANISERAIPSVVNISTSRAVQGREVASPFENDPFFRHFFDGQGQDPHGQRGERGQPGPRGRPGRPGPQNEQAMGSGVIVRADGTILTNNHVVEGADEIKVTLSDKRSYDAKLVGNDPKSDLAVLKIQNPPKDLAALPFGDSNHLRIGEVVLAIGNPFGVGQTVTMGIVSAKGRANMGIVDYEDFIQTDAAINPGNSGGALVNLKGQMVGINTAILSRSGGYQGVGFAIPSEMIEGIMGSLIQDGKVVRGFLGVAIQDLTPELAQALDLEGKTGVLVSEVMPNAPAAETLRPQDVIVALDGKPITSSAQLRRNVAGHRPGSQVEMKVIRNGEEESVTVKLGELPNSDAQIGEVPGAEKGGIFEGLALRDLDDSIRRRFEVAPRVDAGAVIVDVEPNSAAGRAGLRPGDIIIEANRKKVGSVEDLRDAAGNDATQVLLRVHRQGGSIYLVLRK